VDNFKMVFCDMTLQRLNVHSLYEVTVRHKDGDLCPEDFEPSTLPISSLWGADQPINAKLGSKARALCFDGLQNDLMTLIAIVYRSSSVCFRDHLGRGRSKPKSIVSSRTCT